jgi:hypothetical protein
MFITVRGDKNRLETIIADQLILGVRAAGSDGLGSVLLIDKK